jgi:Ca2+/Na+ antiporter
MKNWLISNFLILPYIAYGLCAIYYILKYPNKFNDPNYAHTKEDKNNFKLYYILRYLAYFFTFLYIVHLIWRKIDV